MDLFREALMVTFSMVIWIVLILGGAILFLGPPLILAVCWEDIHFLWLKILLSSVVVFWILYGLSLLFVIG